jgi:hypothetical protein
MKQTKPGQLRSFAAYPRCYPVTSTGEQEERCEVLDPNVSAYSKAGLSSLLAFVVCSMAAIGAPPSVLVQEPSFWRRLEPIMVPALLAGAVLAPLAMILALVAARAAAITCIGATAASSCAVLVANGIDAEAGLRGVVIAMVLLAVPALGALDALRQLHREHKASRGRSLEASAG